MPRWRPLLRVPVPAGPGQDPVADPARLPGLATAGDHHHSVRAVRPRAWRRRSAPSGPRSSVRASTTTSAPSSRRCATGAHSRPTAPRSAATPTRPGPIALARDAAARPRARRPWSRSSIRELTARAGCHSVLEHPGRRLDRRPSAVVPPNGSEDTRGSTVASTRCPRPPTTALLWHSINLVDAVVSDPVGRRRALRRSSILAVEQVFVNGPLKMSIRRDRPIELIEHPHTLRAPLSSSFPSGHASAGACAATLLSVDLGHAPLWWGLAAMVAYSRIHVGLHHASDVAAGAFVGRALAVAAGRIWTPPAPDRRSSARSG